MFLCLLPAAILLAETPAPAPESAPLQGVAAPVAGDQIDQALPPEAAAPEAQVASEASPDSALAPTPPDDTGQDTGIVVIARAYSPADPLEKVNIKSFEATQAFDDKITAPLAHGFEHAVPKPVRSGLHNFITNLHQPGVFVNFLLQHHIGKAAETLARFAINSTIGLAGVIDVAKRKPFKLPQRRNGFADTLGFYGVKPGAFLFAPLLGPTTVRDLVGNVLDRLMPFGGLQPVSGPEFTVSAGVLHTLDRRIAMDDELTRERASGDSYTAAREYYLARRRDEIAALHGKLHKSQDVAGATAMPQVVAVAPAQPDAATPVKE
uniref:MlaA family lipoprotein n=1 Tax=Altererythrobacter segetis TaxID=1104773 RepID=UPI00140B5B07|nr:VacJ family lipoprotein [Altererythrobacter segetis]